MNSNDSRGQVIITLAVLVVAALILAPLWPGGNLFGANAQALSQHPAGFTGSLTEVPAPERLIARRSVYVPAYSAIRLGSGKGTIDLATTLSVRNTSEHHVLVITRADYFDTSGELVQSYVSEPLAVRPFGTVEAFVPVEDSKGGTGANFVVEWAGEGAVPEPVIEAVMIGSSGTTSYSFVSRGQTIETGKLHQ